MNKTLAMEFLIAVAFSSYSAVKAKEMPWPPTVVKTAIAFAIVGIVAAVNDRLAAVLGAGFLMAQLIKVLDKKELYTGGAPEIVDAESKNAHMPGDAKHTFGVLSF